MTQDHTGHHHHDHAHGAPESGRAWFIGLLLAVFAGATIFLLAPKPSGPAPVVPPRAVVTKIVSEDGATGTNVSQQLEAKYLDGPKAGQSFQVTIGQVDLATTRSFAKTNDVFYVGDNGSGVGDSRPFFQDFARSRGAIFIVLIFIIVTLAVSRARGLRALVGLAFSLVVITLYMMPSLVGGGNLIVTASIGSILILGPTYLISYGLTRKMAIALTSTLLALLVSLGLGLIFANVMHLTGLYDEDAVNFALANGKDGVFLFQLLIAGMLIGVLGVLDDVVIAQVSTVAELAEADRTLTRRELFRRVMRVGNDHIASVVNTLVLAYAGASLPTFLYFSASHLPLGYVISNEAVAAEIVRMLVGTICLVLAVPLATALAAFAYRREE